MKVKLTKEIIEPIIKSNYSIAECLRALGLRPAGGNYKTFKAAIKQYNIDVSHFTGQQWSKGKKLDYSNRKVPLSQVLVKDSKWTSTFHLKKRLLDEKIKSHRCEKCNLIEWNSQPIPLELEHINGDNTDNCIENIQLLCPNCHAQTPHYRGRNKRSSLNERRELNRVKFGGTLTGNPEPSPLTGEGVETLRREPNLCSCGNRA